MWIVDRGGPRTIPASSLPSVKVTEVSYMNMRCCRVFNAHFSIFGFVSLAFVAAMANT